MIPATVNTTTANGICISFHEQTTPEQEIPTNPRTFEEYVKTLPSHTQRFFHHIKFVPGSEWVLHECLQQNKIIKVGTNGSLNKEKEMSSFGWLLLGKKQKLVEWSRPVDGVPVFLSSTRTELFGITAPNVFLHLFMKFYKIKLTSKVIKDINNQAAISWVNKMQQKGSRRWWYSDDVNIMTIIMDRLKDLTLRHWLWWVKAHQDDKHPYEDLDVWDNWTVTWTRWQPISSYEWTPEKWRQSQKDSTWSRWQRGSRYMAGWLPHMSPTRTTFISRGVNTTSIYGTDMNGQMQFGTVSTGKDWSLDSSPLVHWST